MRGVDVVDPHYGQSATFVAVLAASLTCSWEMRYTPHCQPFLIREGLSPTFVPAARPAPAQHPKEEMGAESNVGRTRSWVAQGVSREGVRMDHVSHAGVGYTIKALQENSRLQPLSYGEAQARMIRLAAIDEGWASKTGKRGAWICSEMGLKVLIVLREREKTGVSIDTALGTIRAELASSPATDDAESQSAPLGHMPETSLEVENRWLQEKVSVLMAQIDDLRRDRDWFRSIVERTTAVGPKVRRK